MSPDELSNALTERMAERLQPAVAKTAADLTADIQRRINVPVGRSGSRVIRSKPGEPPRREFGNYRASWETRDARSGDEITGTAGTTSNLGPWLERGTSRMAARPHVEPAVNDLKPSLVDTIKQNL